METFKILNNFKKLTSELATYIYQSGNCFQQEAIHSNSPKTDVILESLKALLYKMSNKSLKLTTQLYFYVATSFTSTFLKLNQLVAILSYIYITAGHAEKPPRTACHVPLRGIGNCNYHARSESHH